MFTTEKRKNRYVVHIKTSMFPTEKRKTGMYILKLVYLLQKNGKNGYVVHIKTVNSMFTRVKTAMLYIRYHKIPELSVE